MLGGRLQVSNAPEGGARLVVHVPLTQPSAQVLADNDRDTAEPLFDDSTRGSLE